VSDSSKLTFPSLSPRRTDVEIGDRHFFIEEMTEARSREFKKILVRFGRESEKAQKEGREMPEEGLRLNVVLLSMCMFESFSNGEDPHDRTHTKVTADFLDTLPTSIVEVLDRQARKINGMEQKKEEAEAEAKNS
jgi:hypothetical protein